MRTDRYIETLENAIKDICKEVDKHGTENVSEAKLQETLTKVHCICMIAMPELRRR